MSAFFRSKILVGDQYSVINSNSWTRRNLTRNLLHVKNVVHYVDGDGDYLTVVRAG